MKKNKSKFIRLLKIKHWFYSHHFKIIAKFLDYVTRTKFSCDIPASLEIGNNWKIAHFGLGIVIHPRAKIGDGFTIFQNATIGCRKMQGPPTIGNNVYIGAGACVLGNIKIGNNVSIGANAVVLTDVPDNSIAVGIPAVIKTKKEV
jgi:serine O-acetyltransferase